MTCTSRLAVAALLGLAACTVNPDKIKPTVTDLCNEAANVMGDRWADCFGIGRAYGEWMWPLSLRCSNWSESVSAGRMAYDESAGSQCISDLRSMSCDQLFGSGSSGPPGACALAARGLVGAGSSCYVEQDCAGGTYCDDSATCGGTCTAYATAGQVCFTSSPFSSTRCSPGLNCVATDTTYTTYVCRVPFQTGTPCPTGGCADGLYCDWVTTSLYYLTCQPRVQLNGSCVTYPCAAGLYCLNNTASGYYNTCQPQQTSGQCGQWATCQGPSYVCVGSTSPSYSWTSPGNCQPAWEGQPCKNGYGGCFAATYCKSASASPAVGDPGVCTNWPGAGAKCGTYGGEYVGCIDSYCNASPSGTCTAYVPVGGSCVSAPCGPADYCDASNICRVRCP